MRGVPAAPADAGQAGQAGQARTQSRERRGLRHAECGQCVGEGVACPAIPHRFVGEDRQRVTQRTMVLLPMTVIGISMKSALFSACTSPSPVGTEKALLDPPPIEYRKIDRSVRLATPAFASVLVFCSSR
jgi:hypothetical protein